MFEMTFQSSWPGHAELESRLEIRLVEARIDAVRVERLQVAVEVHVLVRRIGEPVQTLAGARVSARRDDRSSLRAARPAQRYPVAVESGQVPTGSR